MILTVNDSAGAFKADGFHVSYAIHFLASPTADGAGLLIGKAAAIAPLEVYADFSVGAKGPDKKHGREKGEFSLLRVKIR